MPCHLQGKMLNSQRAIGRVRLLTIHDHPHILDKSVDDLQSVRCCRPSLLMREAIQPLQHRLDISLSQKFL
jgi:hypothetical protein